MNLELDDDGYPTEETLETIAKCAPAEGQELAEWLLQVLDCIKAIWHFRDWGWSSNDVKDEIYELPARRFYVSTAGWSGNEDLIRAMRSNFILWHLLWQQHSRGGHFIFQVQLQKPEPWTPSSENHASISLGETP